MLINFWNSVKDSGLKHRAGAAWVSRGASGSEPSDGEETVDDAGEPDGKVKVVDEEEWTDAAEAGG
jgi:hypothetical protein